MSGALSLTAINMLLWPIGICTKIGQVDGLHVKVSCTGAVSLEKRDKSRVEGLTGPLKARHYYYSGRTACVLLGFSYSGVPRKIGNSHGLFVSQV